MVQQRNGFSAGSASLRPSRATGVRRGRGVLSLMIVLCVLAGVFYGGSRVYGLLMAARNAGVPSAEEGAVSAPSAALSSDAQPDRIAAGLPASPDVPLGAVVEGKKESYWIRIVKSTYSLHLYKGNQLVKTYPIAMGENPGNKERVGDRRTPEGDFSVEQIQNSAAWVHDFGDGKGPISGAYGPWFIRLKTGWKGIGIHGTHDPSSIGKMITEGCIRLRNDHVEEVKARLALKARVVIEP